MTFRKFCFYLGYLSGTLASQAKRFSLPLFKGKFPHLYFAYGSNMDKIQMDKRCPGAVPLAICKKLNYRTILNTRGVATIIPE